MARPDDPIGLFDSGVGGLSVLREIRRALPGEDALYFADSGHVPYGNKPPEWIVERSRQIAGFLLGKGAKALVIACNTATAAAAGALRAEWPEVPIVGMEPAVKPAVAASRSGRIGILATVGTLKSARFAALLDTFSHGVQVVVQPAPGLPEAVEAGELDTPATLALVERHVRPLVEAGVDTIVLGCTHYPFLAPAISAVAGPGVTLIETGAAVARQLERRLAAAGLRRPGDGAGGEAFWTSGAVDAGTAALRVLWAPGAVFEAAGL